VLVGWFGASGESTPADQTKWLDVAAAGVGVAGVGSAMLLLNGRRAVGECRRALLPSREERGASAVEPVHVEPRVESADRGADRYVAGANMSKYHRADCPLVGGKAVRVASVRAHVGRGRRPCGVCQPPEA
jgi:hypothetical protein